MINFITSDIAFCPEARAVIDFSGAPEIFEPGLSPMATEKGPVAPWGEGNMLPVRIRRKIDRNEVVASNLLFNIQSAYGQGIRPMRRIVEGNRVTYTECTEPQVLDFFEENDLDGYFLEQVTDMMTYFNVFPEIILSRDGKRIVSLRHLEAMFSRWGSIERGKGEITKHYYCDWENGAAKSDQLTVTPVLSRYDTLNDLRKRASGKDRRFVMQVSMPTPGRTYYSHPYWWSIFLSGWYDLSEMLPKFKAAIIKNHLTVRYVIYLSDAYWQELLRDNAVNPNDTEAVGRLKEEAVGKIMDFLNRENAKGGGILSTKKIFPGGSGKPYEDKFIVIEPIEPAIKGGEFLEDAEEASNIISYAMGVHPNLNGATPGKSKGSLGGSDKRELFMIKQAMMRPFRDRLLKPLNLVKRFNGWPQDIVFAVPEFVFPTLDVERSGKKETVNP